MSTSTLDLASIDAALAGTVFAGKLHHFPMIDSTQTRALADAAAGIEAGHVYIADEQTAGRGRGDHTWHSEPDRGLYLTALVRPQLTGNDALKLSLATGLAAQSALIAAAGYSSDLRWPNDIVTPAGPQRARKLGGILVETALAPNGRLLHAAIGIGINLNQVDFPADLSAVATSARQQTGEPVSRSALIVALLTDLQAEINALEAEVAGSLPQPWILGRFTLASSWTRGKRVEVTEDGSYTGTTDGLTSSGLLRVCCDDNRTRIVRHGGVRELLPTTT